MKRELYMRKKQKIETQQAKKSFAKGLNFYKLFWVFFIACFLGVVVETIWCFLVTHQYQNRTGLVYGPFNLVYGFGAVIITLCLYWLRGHRDLWIFMGGAIIGSAYEYLCSWLQEAVFGTVSWQYDHMPFNLHGRINLLYAFFWGLLALMWLKEIYPRMERWIEKIPNRWGIGLTWVLVVFMVVNSMVSAAAVGRMSQRQRGLAPANTVEQVLDERFPDERIAKIYPSMVYVKD